jgi:hypothetical protein
LNTGDTDNKLDQIRVVRILIESKNIEKDLQPSDITYTKGSTDEGTYLGD